MSKLSLINQLLIIYQGVTSLTFMTLIFYRWKIRIGDFDHASDEDNRNARNLDILKSFIHPQFKTNEAYFDIAILKTNPIELTSLISPICLPSSVKDYDDDAVHLTGWGSKFDAGLPSNKLQRVVLTAFPQRYQLN